MAMTCSLVYVAIEVEVLLLSKVEPRAPKPLFPPHDVSPIFIRSIQEAESFTKDGKHPLRYPISDKDVVWRTPVADWILVDLPRRRTGFRLEEATRTEYRDSFRVIIEKQVK